jgi:hypothetical protein
MAAQKSEPNAGEAPFTVQSYAPHNLG